MSLAKQCNQEYHRAQHLPVATAPALKARTAGKPRKQAPAIYSETPWSSSQVALFVWLLFAQVAHKESFLTDVNLSSHRDRLWQGNSASILQGMATVRPLPFFADACWRRSLGHHVAAQEGRKPDQPKRSPRSLVSLDNRMSLKPTVLPRLRHVQLFLGV